MIKGFKIRVHIKSLNLAQIFDKFRQKGIDVENIKKHKDFTAEFIILNKNFDIAKKILQNFSAEILATENLGVGNFLQVMLSRICVPIALVVSLVIMFFANFFVFKIDVRGLETLSKSEIIKFLRSEENALPINKKNLDLNSLELDLIQNFPQISLVSVMVKGLTLVVNIKEKENFVPQNAGDIIANFNGRITALNLVSGTANVVSGDIVKAGDVLVSAHFNNQPVKAEATITAEVWLESTYCHFDTTYQTVRTGKKQVLCNVFFMGLPIYQPTPPTQFDAFETEIKQTKLHNTILPFVIETQTYYQVQTIETTSDFQDYKDDIVQECKKNALQQCADGDIIKSEKTAVSRGNGCTFVSYVVTVERHI